jgi:hypothetical protein
MNGNTGVLQRAIIGAQRIPHLKTPAENRHEKEMQALLADNKSLLAQIASMTVDNTALRTQVLKLQDRIAKLVARFPIADDEPFSGLTFVRPRIADIIDMVSRYFEIPQVEMRGSGRCLAVITPRHIAMYLCRNLTFHSYPAIGKAFGGRDHTTAMHAHHRIAELRKTDERLNQQITEIEARFLLPNDALDPPGRVSSEPASCSIPQGAGSLT